MKCPHCSFENKDDAPFCEGCGHVFLSSDRVSEVPDPAELERRREAALTDVPPIVQVPDIAPADATGVIRKVPTVPEVVPSATGPLDRTSVAHLVDLPEPPREPDFSGFERLVDSSYVPPSGATAGDTAEIPVIRDGYMPRPRNYTLGLSPREQRKLEKKFAKAQRKEEERAAREAALREHEAALAAAEAEREARALEGERAAEEARRAAEAEAEAEQKRRAAEEAAALQAADGMAPAPGLDAAEDAPKGEPSEGPSPSDGALPAPTADDEPTADRSRTLPAADLDTVIMTGDGVVSLFEKTGRHHGVRPMTPTEALELPGAEQGLAVVGERGIEAAGASEEPGTSLTPAAEAPGALAASEADARLAAPEPSATTAIGEQATSVSADEAAAPAYKTAPANTGDFQQAPAAKAAQPARDRAEAPAQGKAGGSARKEKRAPKEKPAAAKARPPRSKAPLIAAVAIALIVAIALVAGGTYMAEIWGGKTVPDVVGMTRDEAVAQLGEKGFSAEVTEVKSDEAPGTVLAEEPSGGRRASEGSAITLEVAVSRVIPDIKGKDRQEAADALAAEGFTVIEYKEKKSNKDEGTVLKVSPKAGTEAKSTEPITVTMAIPFTVPEVEGMGTDEAKQVLADEGYEVKALWSYTEDVPEGTALYTEPEAGTVLDSGSEVMLYLAKSRASELVAKAESILPGARLKNAEGRFIIDSVQNVSYEGDDVVSYTCEAHQYEDVALPFGKGTTRVEDDKRVTLKGTLTFNSDDEVTTADPAIAY